MEYRSLSLNRNSKPSKSPSVPSHKENGMSTLRYKSNKNCFKAASGPHSHNFMAAGSAAFEVQNTV